jgi:hypothetical protein
MTNFQTPREKRRRRWRTRQLRRKQLCARPSERPFLGPLAEIVGRNWGALITLMGAMLIYGALIFAA